MHLWPPEVQEGGVALLPELLVLLTLHAPHPLHHLLAQLHGWRQWLRVAAQDVTEVNVEQLPCKEDLNVLEFLCMLRRLLIMEKKTAWPVFVSSKLSKCLSPTPRMYVMTQYPAAKMQKLRHFTAAIICSAGTVHLIQVTHHSSWRKCPSPPSWCHRVLFHSAHAS